MALVDTDSHRPLRPTRWLHLQIWGTTDPSVFGLQHTRRAPDNRIRDGWLHPATSRGHEDNRTSSLLATRRELGDS